MKLKDMTREQLQQFIKDKQAEINELESEIGELESRKGFAEDLIYDAEEELRLLEPRPDYDEQLEAQIAAETERQKRYLDKWLRPGRVLADYWRM